jgi:hypothetical protein
LIGVESSECAEHFFLRGDFKASEYGSVVLPFTLLRRLECLRSADGPALKTALIVNDRHRRSSTLASGTQVQVYRGGMATTETGQSQAWVPQACTLPTAQQPLRVAEFDTLFTTALGAVRRAEPTRLRLTLDGAPEVEVAARELTDRETQCCSFFGFTFARADDGSALYLDVEVPEAHVDVLDGLTERAQAAVSASSGGRPA